MIHVLAKFGHDWPSSSWEEDVNRWWWTPTHSTRSPELLMWPKKVYNSFIYLTPSTLYIKWRIDTDFTSPICFYGLKLKFTTKQSFLFLHKTVHLLLWFAISRLKFCFFKFFFSYIILMCLYFSIACSSMITLWYLEFKIWWVDFKWWK